VLFDVYRWFASTLHVVFPQSKYLSLPHDVMNADFHGPP
jgi:hypothetical protein